jgi:hypothetical protein
VVRHALADIVKDEERVAKQAEIVNELLAALEQRSKVVDRDDHFALPPRRLTSVHRTPFSHREGPFWHPETNTDYFFITLEKSEKYYSPSTRYRDYAIADRFHWKSGLK